MMFFLPQGRYPENFVLISQCVRKGGSRRGVLGGCSLSLIGDTEDRFIHGLHDVPGRPKGSYPKSFVAFSFFFAEI